MTELDIETYLEHFARLTEVLQHVVNDFKSGSNLCQ